MKPHRYIWILACIVAVIQQPAVASVNVTHSDTNHLTDYYKVTLRRTINCGEYYNFSGYCEHYLAYGESLVFNDSDGGGCSVVYSIDFASWVTTLPSTAISINKALTNWNIDNDDNSNESIGAPNQPGADYLQNVAVSGENDLVGLNLSVSLEGMTTGVIRLTVTNSVGGNSRLYESASKSGTAFLNGAGVRGWSLPDTPPDTLYIEGNGLGTATFKLEIIEDGGKILSSNSVGTTFVAAVLGKQPTIEERNLWQGNPLFPTNLLGCEWSITGPKTLNGGPDPVYNCIGWSVDIEQHIWNSLDMDNDGVLEDSDFDTFYATHNYSPCSLEDAEIMLYKTGSPHVETHFTNPTGIQHAARKVSGTPSGAGNWIMFESKLGYGHRIEHKRDALNGNPEYGSHYRYYKKN